MTVHTMCSFVFVGVEDSLALDSQSDFSNLTYASRTRDDVAMVVDWVVGSKSYLDARKDRTSYACQQNTSCIDDASGGYRCACLHGYRGNPYLSPGCTGKYLTRLSNVLNKVLIFCYKFGNY